jgi:hypothetical protein
MARRRKDTEATDPEPRDNGFDPDQLAGFVGRIEGLQADIDEINLAAREATTPLRKYIGNVKREATDAGIGRTELTAVLRRRRLEHRAAHVADGLDLSERARFDEMLECLERLALQMGPLGRAAKAAFEQEVHS